MNLQNLIKRMNVAEEIPSFEEIDNYAALIDAIERDDSISVNKILTSTNITLLKTFLYYLPSKINTGKNTHRMTVLMVAVVNNAHSALDVLMDHVSKLPHELSFDDDVSSSMLINYIEETEEVSVLDMLLYEGCFANKSSSVDRLINSVDLLMKAGAMTAHYHLLENPVWDANLPLVKFLVEEKGIDINPPRLASNGLSILTMTVYDLDSELENMAEIRSMFDYLLSKDANLPHNNGEFLKHLLSLNSSELLEGLVPYKHRLYTTSYNYDPYEQALHECSGQNCLFIARSLEIPVQKKYHQAHMIRTLRYGNVDDLNFALNSIGISPNLIMDINHLLPLHYCIKPEMANLLIKKGAQLDAPSYFKSFVNHHLTCFHIHGISRAQKINHATIASLLINSGAQCDLFKIIPENIIELCELPFSRWEETAHGNAEAKKKLALFGAVLNAIIKNDYAHCFKVFNTHVQPNQETSFIHKETLNKLLIYAASTHSTKMVHTLMLLGGEITPLELNRAKRQSFTFFQSLSSINHILSLPAAGTSTGHFNIHPGLAIFNRVNGAKHFLSLKDALSWVTATKMLAIKPYSSSRKNTLEEDASSSNTDYVAKRFKK